MNICLQAEADIECCWCSKIILHQHLIDTIEIVLAFESGIWIKVHRYFI